MFVVELISYAFVGVSHSDTKAAEYSCKAIKFQVKV